MKPLCIELFAGLHGWGAGAVAAGFRVVGFDIANMPKFCGLPPEPGCDLVIQDVLTLHGSQFRDAALIVASPPCQNYSYLAMPWSRSTSEHSQKAKAMRRKWETEGPDNRLFDACFRIQREAIEATRKVCLGCQGVGWNAGFYLGDRWHCAACNGKGWWGERHIPLIVENVRGAQEWVGVVFYGLDAWMAALHEQRWRMGRSAWNHGSFHLWGDVPALMPVSLKVPPKRAMDDLKYGQRSKAFEHLPVGTGPLGRNGPKEGVKTQGGSWFRERNGVPQPGIRREDRGVKNSGGSWFKIGSPGQTETNRNPVHEGTKIGGHWFSDPNSTCRKHGSRSNARKIASAMIAKIPFDLARHIARVYYPK